MATRRLTLRAHRSADLPACAAMWADPQVVRYIGGKPSTPQQTWSRLLAYVGHWALMGFGYWALEETASGTFVGEVGFADFARTLEPSITGVPELGWALAPAYHRRGYASEALAAVSGWGDHQLPGARTVCLIDPENAASLRLAEKCGYALWRSTAYNGTPLAIFSRKKPSAPAETAR